MTCLTAAAADLEPHPSPLRRTGSPDDSPTGSAQQDDEGPAAYAAGLAVGFWKDLDELAANWKQDKRWEPQMDAAERDRQLRLWRKAVTKSMDWVDDDVR